MSQLQIATMNIYERLAQIRKQVEVMKRTKKGYGYNYTPDVEILPKVTALMDKYEISLVPGIIHNSLKVVPYNYKKTKVTKTGDFYDENVNDVIVTADTVWTWINNNNPMDKLEIPWAITGQQSDASQSLGSGLSYARRYFLLQYFSIATVDDDPDAFRSKQRQAEAEADQMITSKIVQSIDAYVKGYLANNPNARENVLHVVKKYVKNGNYFEIKDQIIAAKLFAELKSNLKAEPNETQK